MRRAILSITVALLGAGAVTASGWALQAAALPPPKPAALVAADASTWLHDYRLAVDVFHVDHRRIEGACLRGWFHRPGGPKVRGSLLSLKPVPAPHASSRGVTVAKVRSDRLLLARLGVVVGCTGKLEGALAAAAQNGVHLTAERAYAANRPAIALEWSRGRDKNVTLFVSPETDQPLVAISEIAGRSVTARLYLARARPRLLTRFDLPARPSRRTER